MKKYRYFWAESGRLWPIEETSKLLHTSWHKDETLKIELWPFDLKIGPTGIPNFMKREYDKQKQEERYTREQADYQARRNQEPLLRLNKTSSPYSEESSKRDDARNRTHLSKRVSERRKNRKKPPAQDDAPF